MDTNRYHQRGQSSTKSNKHSLCFGNSAGKKRLILDLRYINEHLYKEKIKFDDWKCFENYLEHTDGYVFKFDLKSAYHHVDVFKEHQTYLGFSRKIDYLVKFFLFTVLPIALSTAPFAFAKVVRPLVKYLRLNSIKITCFLDEGLGIKNAFEKALEKSTFVSNSLIFLLIQRNRYGSQLKSLPGFALKLISIIIRIRF